MSNGHLTSQMKHPLQNDATYPFLSYHYAPCEAHIVKLELKDMLMDGQRQRQALIDDSS